MAKKRGKVSFSKFMDVLSAGRDSAKGMDEGIVIRVHVDPTGPRALATALKEALVAERLGGIVEVTSVAPPSATAIRPDVAIILVGEAKIADLAALYAYAEVCVALVVEGALDAPRLDLPDEVMSYVGVVAASDPKALPDKLASWLERSLEDKRLALAANFPFCRSCVVDGIVSRCAIENATAGAIPLFHNSDIAVMCVSQVKMALDIAAAYGYGLDVWRAVEAAGVVGAGLVYRSIVRAVTKLVPGFSFLLKVSMSYGGTVLTGKALRLRFEAQDSPERVAAARDKVAEVVMGHVAHSSVPAPALVAPQDDGYIILGESA